MKRNFIFFGLASLAVAANVSAATAADFYGSAVPSGKAARTVVIDDNLKHVNVRFRETLTLACGETRVTWQFDGIRSVVPSEKILPAAVCKKNVPIYVEAEPQG